MNKGRYTKKRRRSSKAKIKGKDNERGIREKRMRKRVCRTKIDQVK